MFCPACSVFLNERDIVKTAVKYAPGNVPIEYDARCPECRAEMGRVSWGQLTVDPKYANQTPAPAPKPEVQQEEIRNAEPHHKTCPHCGKALPEGF